MKRILLLALFFVSLSAACWERCAETNRTRAYFTREGHLYRVEMKGRRFPLVHDPLSLLLASTYEATFTLDLPRIEGVVDGHEIGSGYAGRVAIEKGRMKIDLYYQDDGTRRPLSWNDEYELVQKATVTR